jgi:hypothetical protein
MNMKLARWSYSEVKFMAKWGNKRANALFILSTQLIADTGQQLFHQIHSGETIALGRRHFGLWHMFSLTDK